MKTFVLFFAEDESGATAIEYGLIVAMISIALITGLNQIQAEMASTFTDVSTGLAAR